MSVWMSWGTRRAARSVKPPYGRLLRFAPALRVTAFSLGTGWPISAERGTFRPIVYCIGTEFHDDS